jgi:hypothetical protein
LNSKKAFVLCGIFLLAGALAYSATSYYGLGGNPSANVGVKIALTVVYGQHDAKTALSSKGLTLLSEGYTPSCWIHCSGISWRLDPTTHVTNNGLDFIQCKLGGTASVITCTSADLTNYLSVSVSGGYTPLFTDTACHATVQTSDGYSVHIGTVTPASPSAGSVTWQVAYTWTDTTAGVSNIDLACLQTEASGGGNVVLYAEGQIGSTSTNIGDSLETIWQITYSSS